MENPRYLSSAIRDDLKEKMVFIGGPRQVGKTTLAKMLAGQGYKNSQYLNWDNRNHRRDILAQSFAGSADLVIFDEIHKYRPWKNFVKGLYDTHKKDFDILVTGSARLDFYRKGGDSLMGRYHYYRLHPFSLAEAAGIKNTLEPFVEPSFPKATGDTWRIFNELVSFGGFPEPFLKKDPRTLRRFHNERMERLVKEDIRDTEAIRDLGSLELMAELLAGKVGSLFSMNSLREDLQVTHKTISHWADVLERFYYHYRLYPYASGAIKSLRKEPKLYLWDWSQVQEPGARLENMVASHLLKAVHFLEDHQGHKADLHFVRDVDGREVDFLVTADKKPWFMVEVKSKSLEVSKPLLYFKEKIKVPFCYQLTTEPNVDFRQKGVRVISADKFLGGLV